MTSTVGHHHEFPEPIIRRKMVTAVNEAEMMTRMDFGEFGEIATDEPIAHGGTSEGPSPLQTVLAALCGCESVTFRRTATELEFDYERITWQAEFTIDIRGRLGMRGVTQHFKTVRAEATVFTSESAERLAEVVEETEARCPVYNLMKDAGINLEVRWLARPPGSADATEPDA